MAQISLLIMAGSLIFAVIACGRIKKSGFDMLDAYFLMIMLYFGVYSLIDAFINQAAGKDAALVVLTFILIFLAMLVTWGLYLTIPLKLRKVLRFENLIEQWANVDRKTIFLLAAIFFTFNGYLYLKFGMLTYAGTELDRLGISLPTWVGPVKSLMQEIGFSCYVSLVSSVITRRIRIFSLFGLLLLVLTFVLSLDGRRAVIELMLIAFILWSCFRRQNVYSFKYAPHALIMLAIFVLASNLYQTYRTELLSIKPTSGSGEVTRLSDAAGNFDATIDNYRQRLAMWNFNYMLTAEQAEKPFKVFWGSLGWQSFLNAVPTVLWSSKKVADPDEMVDAFYGFGGGEGVDFPSNDFADFQADFGFLMLIILPMVSAFVLFLAAYSKFLVPENSLLSLIIPVFCLEYLIKIENAYGVIFIMLRDISVITVLWLISILFLRFFRKLSSPRSLR